MRQARPKPIYFTRSNLRRVVSVERLPFSFAAPKTSRHCKVQLARSWRRWPPFGRRWEISSCIFEHRNTQYTVPKFVLILPLLHCNGSSFTSTVVEQWPNLSSHQPFCCQMKILQQNVAMVERDLAGNTGMLEIFKCIAFLWIHQQPGVWVSCKQFMWKSWW